MLIVAVHDVASATVDDVRWLLARLDAAGVRPRVLKVVPGWHSQGADHGAGLPGLVRDEASRGSEIVLHGWSHRAEGPPRGAVLDRLRARLSAPGAAEFLSIPPDEMRRRLVAGREWLAARGLAPAGFCPPAWLAAPELAGLAREEGFRYLISLRGLRDLRDGRWRTLPPTGYMGFDGWRELLVNGAGGLIARPLSATLRAPAHRVFLHPQGARTSPACARVLRGVERLARHHRPVTYAELLDA